jgi:hypothetical protein
VDNLDPARRAQAEEVCRWAGVTSTWQFLECVFDVGVTGRPEFAVGGATTEVIAPPLSAPIPATPIASGTLTVGTTDKVTFTGHSGQAVFVDATGPTMADSCSPYQLLDPAGKTINTGCNINGVGYVDRTELPADGQYTVTLDPRYAKGNHAFVRVYADQDTRDAIEPNGPAKVAAIEQPGAVARYTFTGTGGQRVFVNVAESNLPDQCSPLKLVDPAGHQLRTGCVINGYGDVEGTVLPADGTYTVVVDPGDRTIGTSTVQLYQAADQTGIIAVNGPAVTAVIGQPGFVIRYRFSAAAGASVSVVATDATLPDQCSPLGITDEAGHQIHTGCVINGRGDISKTVLPAAGTYYLVVDPSDDATGQVTLTLRG